MNIKFGNISSIVQYTAPYVLLVFLFVLDNIFLRWSAFNEIRPGFLLMAVYYWAIYRPRLLPPTFIFIIALAKDVIEYTPLGLHGLLYLPLYLFLRRQRRFLYEQPFFVVWLGFAAITTLANFALWALIRASQYGFDFTMRDDDFMNILYDSASGIFVFPIVAILLFFIHRMLPQKARRGGEIK
ncbi:MAG: rod shape-determining protein MreD [Pseudomonadota bacterium]|nr:rod shape-determining protein MreD [Pseudomonadota bacterium]MEC9236995.1 rod shape-determining protein MreD [Pseudomonadota bacterium]MEE3322612.1 rod shape-determining protein MreD [Pseudomonadota bacterium]